MPQLPVLIVEEDPGIAVLLEEVLTDHGYSVEHATNPAAALSLLSTRGADAFGLVLSTPYATPDEDAYVWLDQLRRATSAPIVICSRWSSGRFADYAARGYAALVREPFDLSALRAVVAALYPLAPAASPPQSPGSGRLRWRTVGHRSFAFDRATQRVVASCVQGPLARWWIIVRTPLRIHGPYRTRAHAQKEAEKYLLA